MIPIWWIIWSKKYGQTLHKGKPFMSRANTQLCPWLIEFQRFLLQPPSSSNIGWDKNFLFQKRKKKLWSQSNCSSPPEKQAFSQKLQFEYPIPEEEFGPKMIQHYVTPNLRIKWLQGTVIACLGNQSGNVPIAYLPRVSNCLSNKTFWCIGLIDSLVVFIIFLVTLPTSAAQDFVVTNNTTSN